MNFTGKHGPLLIAEIGGNHEGNFEYAKKLTELAISTNIDYIKYQLYTGDTLVSPVESSDRNKHFKKFELSIEEYIELAKMVTNAGIGFMASVWNTDYIKVIDKYMPIYKIGSGDLTAYPILEVIAKIGKPIILSTGLSTMEEVLNSISFIQGVNEIYKDSNFLSILQCTSMYPIKKSDANLKVMDELRAKTGLSVGYSDHTEGLHALKYAYAMGAEVLEFHFTDSREGKAFRDHKVSLTPKEVIELIKEINIINELKGDGIKRPLPIEIEADHVRTFRRGLYVTRDMKAGEIISQDDIKALRPCNGIGANEFKSILGRQILNFIRKGEKLEKLNIK